MPAGIPGRKTLIKISTTLGGSTTTVLGIDSATPNFDASAVDDSEYGVTWAQKLAGLKNGKMSIGGKRRPNDTNGQNVLVGMFTTGTPETIFVHFLPDGGTTPNIGFKVEAILTNCQFASAVDDKVGFTAEFEFTGPPTVV